MNIGVFPGVLLIAALPVASVDSGVESEQKFLVGELPAFPNFLLHSFAFCGVSGLSQLEIFHDGNLSLFSSQSLL